MTIGGDYAWDFNATHITSGLFEANALKQGGTGIFGEQIFGDFSEPRA
jgi:hypothetical protein